MKERDKIKRYRLIVKINRHTELPLIILGLVWLVLLVIELIWKLSPVLNIVVNIIWIIFIIDFLIKFTLAPSRIRFLEKNILTLISLFIPALRIFRIFASLSLLRSLGFIRSLRLIRIVASVNRGMRILGGNLERRGFGYIILLTLLITFVGAAAIYAFEEKGTFINYLDALYWTAMLLTTQGMNNWPTSFEGKVIGFLLAIYSLGVLGYFTALLASFFIGQDALNKKGEVAGSKELEDIKNELALLREEIRKSRE